MNLDFDIIIVGAGLVGMSAALALAHKTRLSVAVLDRHMPDESLAPDFDGRASALAASSFEMMTHLSISAALEGHISPIENIEIMDGGLSSSGMSAPLCFSGLPSQTHTEEAPVSGGRPMGYMIENRRLRHALLSSVLDHPHIRLLAPISITGLDQTADAVRLHLSDGKSLSCRICVGADGGRSYIRREAGIKTRGWNYKQKALVTTVSFEGDHKNTAYEAFFPQGPFAVLPMTPSLSSPSDRANSGANGRANIVWSDHPEAIDAAKALPEDMFLSELSRRIGPRLGHLKQVHKRWVYPLSLQLAEHYMKGRIVLVGDAAHLIHPIAGQGLNLGLRDGAALADEIVKAQKLGLDIGGSALSDYARWRRFDNQLMGFATDIFTRLYSTDKLPVKHMRRLGMGLLDKAGPAKHMVVKEAMGETGELPSLMQSLSAL